MRIFSFYYRQMLPEAVLGAGEAGRVQHAWLAAAELPRPRADELGGAARRDGDRRDAALDGRQADAGAIVDQLAVPISRTTRRDRCSTRSASPAEIVLWRSLPAIRAGKARASAERPARGSYFGARRPEDGRIDWSRPAAEVYNLIRAVAPPYPGAFTDVAGVRLVIAKARIALPSQRPRPSRNGPRAARAGRPRLRRLRRRRPVAGPRARDPVRTRHSRFARRLLSANAQPTCS
jgi:methionyl-tRNA formyltransferase